MTRSSWHKSPLFLHLFNKAKHVVSTGHVRRHGHVGIAVVIIPELHDVEPADIYVEMDVPLLKIGSRGFPCDAFWKHCLKGEPRAPAKALPMTSNLYEEQIQAIHVRAAIDHDDRAANLLSIGHDVENEGIGRS